MRDEVIIIYQLFLYYENVFQETMFFLLFLEKIVKGMMIFLSQQTISADA